MDQVITMETESPAPLLTSVVCDVSSYPEWLDLVTKVDADGDAWLVTLRATVGPFARSKRLRMVEEVNQDTSQFDLVRSETDGRNHAEWRMTSRVTETTAGSDLEFRLHYGGSLWTGILDSVLSSRVESTRPRLLSYLATKSAL